MTSKTRSMLLAYVIWVLTGAVGGHRFYLGKISSGAVMFLLSMTGLMTLSAGVGAVILAGIWFWTLVDAVLIPDMMQKQSTDPSGQLIGAHLDNTRWWHADRQRYLQQDQLSFG